jgi:hypothetical protein
MSAWEKAGEMGMDKTAGDVAIDESAMKHAASGEKRSAWRRISVLRLEVSS